jgi:hypothetical protein
LSREGDVTALAVRRGGGGDESLQPATAAETESLLRKAADLCRAVGLRWVGQWA